MIIILDFKRVGYSNGWDRDAKGSNGEKHGGGLYSIYHKGNCRKSYGQTQG